MHTAADKHREEVMSRWHDFRRAMAAELFLLAYAMAWVVALLVTHLLTK
ncbi:MAG: hypothetical protein OJF51_000408 [Nitrospira sp.]|nr:MAG: hypothetical protein OJF51_000408 [Nitrospira sp.]